ncbi:MAG: hypothetical protein NTY30_03110 [Candidatus Berkelbacteria bacterium]|nr:hypothetical protein [Candidatus Berkelbacteria bacterium]
MEVKLSTPKKKQPSDVTVKIVTDDDLIDEPGPEHPWTQDDDEAVASHKHPHPDFGGVTTLALPVGF